VPSVKSVDDRPGLGQYSARTFGEQCFVRARVDARSGFIVQAVIGVQILLGGASLARTYLGGICGVYDDVFSRPPFLWRDGDSVSHREQLTGMLEIESFGLALAVHSGRVVGFAYGFALNPEMARWSQVRPPLEAAATREWAGRTFLLFDYAVTDSYRGRGIGRALHDCLLGSRREERATLTVQPAAAATKELYERWGWRMLGQMDLAPAGLSRVFDVYLRESLDDLTQASG
jgi:GNAT superfamily N-acetyltransferase